MSIRLISSVSGVITNSSTEIFIIQGPDVLRQMTGTGIYKKYKKDFVYLKTEEDIIEFILDKDNRKSNHNYYSEMIISLVGKDIFESFKTCLRIFKDDKEKEKTIIELFKPIFIKELKDTIIYYDIKNNQRVLNRLISLYPDESYYNVIEKDGYRYEWRKD